MNSKWTVAFLVAGLMACDPSEKTPEPPKPETNTDPAKTSQEGSSDDIVEPERDEPETENTDGTDDSQDRICPSCIKDFFASGCFDAQGACESKLSGDVLSYTWANGAKVDVKYNGTKASSYFYGSSSTLCYESTGERTPECPAKSEFKNKSSLKVISICSGNSSKPDSVVCPNGESVALSRKAWKDCGMPPDCQD